MSSRSNIDMATRAQIIAFHNQGLNYSEISRETGLNVKTVTLWVKRFQEEGSLEHRSRSGRRRHIDSDQRQLMVQGYEENGFTPTRYYAELFDTSLRTVYRVLHSEGLHYRRHAIKPLLTEANKRARLEFALKYRNFDWTNVIFSDEKTFKSSQHGRVMLWRRNNTRYDSDHIVPNCESGRITVNMWGWMSAAGPGELAVIPCRANSVNYIDVLNDVMLPTVRNVFPVEDVPVITFVQDNCPIHRSKIVQEWFRQQSDIQIIPWPARSPDLNPIENLWGVMVQRWDNRNERNKEALSTHCMQVWDSLRGLKLCEKLINSMGSRLQAVIDQNGGHTSY